MAKTIRGRGIFVVKHDTDVSKAALLKDYELDQPKGNDLLIKMLAAPINPSDIYCIMGSYPGVGSCPFTVGFEGVGEVIAKGDHVKTLSIGDWVMPAVKHFGTWRTHCVVAESKVLPFKKGIDFKSAATIFINPYTAYLLLTDVVALKPGDVVLQNGANSTVGQALIQFAKDKGIKTINVIRKREAKAEAALKKKLQDLGADYVLTDEELKQRGQEETWSGNLPKPKLVIDCVGGEAGSELIRHLPNGGTFVNYGVLSGKNVDVSPGDLIFRDIKVVGLWLTSILEKTPDRAVKEIGPYILKLLAEGKYTAPDCELFRLDDYQKAMKRAIGGYTNLKQLLVMDETLMK